MDTKRFDRVVNMLMMLLSGRSLNADEMAREMEVSRRTVFRDLHQLELLKVPYYFDQERNGYRARDYFFLPPVNLTVAEALSLIVMAGQRHSGRKLPFLSHGLKAAVKLQCALPAEIRRCVSAAIDQLSVSLGPLSRHDGCDATFEQLVNAIARKQVCRIDYMSFYDRRQVALTVHPLRLAFVSRAWYLLAWSVQHKKVLTFKVGRIRKLSVGTRSFTARARVDIDKHFGNAWCMIPEGKLHGVHLRFAPKVAGNVDEVQWHRTQSTSRNDDGSLDFTATVDGLGEITWWILGYGDQVEVLGPPELRRRVGEAASKMAAIYRKGARS